MSFFKAISSVFSKFATFSGRARRKEFFCFALFVYIVETLFFVITTLLNISNIASTVVSGIVCVLFAIALLAVSCRRLHDIGKSGLWLLLLPVPVIDLVLLFWFLKDSQPGANRYGENPKQ